jgi:hypothetical protein
MEGGDFGARRREFEMLSRRSRFRALLGESAGDITGAAGGPLE